MIFQSGKQQVVIDRIDDVLGPLDVDERRIRTAGAARDEQFPPHTDALLGGEFHVRMTGVTAHPAAIRLFPCFERDLSAWKRPKHLIAHSADQF